MHNTPFYIVFNIYISRTDNVERRCENDKKISKVQIDLKIFVVILSMYFFLMLTDYQTCMKIGIYRYLPKYVNQIVYKNCTRQHFLSHVKLNYWSQRICDCHKRKKQSEIKYDNEDVKMVSQLSY